MAIRTEERIERDVELATDALDHRYMTTGMSEAEYKDALAKIDRDAQRAIAMPTGLRNVLLAALALAYPADAAQAHMDNSPDAAIAWQVQSMLDDHVGRGCAA